GDLLRRWTNDRWCSNVHRVLPPPSEEPTEELISLVYFGEPNPDALVETFPSCITAHRPAQYDPILACDYLDRKMAELVVD
ncbi:MAG: isopenicillin N synthase family oxygenase, partial [Actinomycetota bacterium]